MIPVEYAKAKDIADVLRQVYVDRLVVARNQPRQGRRGGIASLMRGMMGTGGGQGQNPSDAATRISIGVDTHTNTLVIARRRLFIRRGQTVGPATRHGQRRGKRNGAGLRPPRHQRDSRCESHGSLRERCRADNHSGGNLPQWRQRAFFPAALGRPRLHWNVGRTAVHGQLPGLPAVVRRRSKVSAVSAGSRYCSQTVLGDRERLRHCNSDISGGRVGWAEFYEPDQEHATSGNQPFE